MRTCVHMYRYVQCVCVHVCVCVDVVCVLLWVCRCPPMCADACICVYVCVRVQGVYAGCSVCGHALPGCVLASTL